MASKNSQDGETTSTIQSAGLFHSTASRAASSPEGCGGAGEVHGGNEKNADDYITGGYHPRCMAII